MIDLVGSSGSDVSASIGMQIRNGINELINKVGADDKIIKAEAIQLAGLPQTPDAPAGFGNVADTVNALFLRSGFVTPEEFGAVGDGINDDTDAIYNAHATNKSVVYQSNKEYLITEINRIPLFDGCVYLGNNCTIKVPSGVTLTDTSGSFGRFNNHLFQRFSTAALINPLTILNFNINILSAKVNFIGAGDTRHIRDSHTAAITLRDITLQHTGTPSGIGGSVSNAVVGSLLFASGYIVTLDSISTYDTGNAVICFGSKVFSATKVRTYYCGVSRDYTSWTNTSALLVRSSEEININNCFSYITGGSSYFASQDSIYLSKRVIINNNTLIGCGLSAISAGNRDGITTVANIEFIEIKLNKILGWCCGIGADFHSGIKVQDEGVTGGFIGSVDLDNYLDYLAPWETYSTSTGTSGSFNQLKTKGFDVGNQYGVYVAGKTNKIPTVKVKGVVKNHQRLGVGVSDSDKINLDVHLVNNGWSRDVSNAAYQIQQSLRITTCNHVICKAVISKQSDNVLNNVSWCTPIYLENNVYQDFDITVTESGSQNRVFRYNNTLSVATFKISSMESDTFLVDAGIKVYIDRVGANVNDVLYKVNQPFVDVITGSRTMQPTSGFIKKSASDSAGRTMTLLPAKTATGSKIEFYGGGAGTLTVTASGAELIDAVNSFNLTSGQKATLLSTGTGWITL